MRGLQDRDIAIIGFGTTKLTRKGGRGAIDLAGEAADIALRHAGVERAQIDGFATTMAMSDAPNPFWSNLVLESLDLNVGWCQATDIGGGSALANIARAGAAIRSGMCETVLCVAADAVSTIDRTWQHGHRTEFCDLLGYAGPLTVFGLLGSVYAERHGWPEAALGKLAVAQRRGALLNEHACEVLRKPLSMDDYFASRLVCDPLRMLDCVMRVDGATAFVVTSTQRAKQMGVRKMAHPIAYREAHNIDPLRQDDDLLRTGFGELAPRLFADAGMTPRQVDMLQPYDDFTLALVLQLEQLGFCAPGQASAFIAEHAFGFDGDLPLNTGGGLLSAGQVGSASGGLNLHEGLTQLFGEAGERQVKRHHNALVTGIGIMQYARGWAASNAMILERGE
ncbi:MAG: thiolase family protein [Lysobacteraceae bacterium]|nr:MAG: thiolase family protein [Xanthomonadaceae bacterium]